MPMKYYSRKDKVIKEEEKYGEKQLNFLYKTKRGRFLLKYIFTKPLFSKICSLYYKSSFSKNKIKKFVKQHSIDCDISKYCNFNEFFTRKHEPFTLPSCNNAIISPADSKMSVYKISENKTFNIKNSVYTIEEILEDSDIANKFSNGTCFVFRLTPMDNHRYFCIDDYFILKSKKIKGVLHTVKPISNQYKIFSRNSREIAIIKTPNLGNIVQIEIGALLIGKIHNHGKRVFKKYEEKGYFEYGGSTIVILTNKNIIFDDDIKKYIDNGIEVSVCAGEQIGKILPEGE